MWWVLLREAEAKPERAAEPPPDLQTQRARKPLAAELLLVPLSRSARTSAWDLVDLAALTEIDAFPQPATPALMKLLGLLEIQTWQAPVVPVPQPPPSGSKVDQGERSVILEVGQSSTYQAGQELVEVRGTERAKRFERLPAWATQVPEVVHLLERGMRHLDLGMASEDVA